MARENFRGALQRAADQFAEIVKRGSRHNRARFQPRHVEKIGDEAVQSLGLVDDGGQQFGLRRLIQSHREIAQRPAAPRIDASGVLRSCEIEVSSAERNRSASMLRLARSNSSTRNTRSIASALWSISASSNRPLIRREQRTRLVAVDADDADRPAAGTHRQKQALRARQGVGATARRVVALPCPFRRRDVRICKRILRRVARFPRRWNRLRATAAPRGP